MADGSPTAPISIEPSKDESIGVNAVPVKSESHESPVPRSEPQQEEACLRPQEEIQTQEVPSQAAEIQIASNGMPLLSLL